MGKTKEHDRFLQVKAAVEAWWQDGDGSVPAAKHTHVEGCLRDWDGTPCNPTCGINSVRVAGRLKADDEE